MLHVVLRHNDCPYSSDSTLVILESELPSFFKGASHLYYEQLKGEKSSKERVGDVSMSRAACEPGRPKQANQSQQRSQGSAGSETVHGKGT